LQPVPRRHHFICAFYDCHFPLCRRKFLLNELAAPHDAKKNMYQARGQQVQIRRS